MAIPVSPRRLKQLVEAAYSDFTTGIPNLRAFRRELARLLPRFRQGQVGPFALVLIDVKGFTGINERFGHDKANEVLRLFAHALQGRIKSSDHLARFGGDEFVGIVRVKNYEQLEGVLQRLRRKYILDFEGRRIVLHAYAVGTLARRRRDGDFIEGRVHVLLNSAKRAAKQSGGRQ